MHRRRRDREPATRTECAHDVRPQTTRIIPHRRVIGGRSARRPNSNMTRDDLRLPRPSSASLRYSRRRSIGSALRQIARSGGFRVIELNAVGWAAVRAPGAVVTRMRFSSRRRRLHQPRHRCSRSIRVSRGVTHRRCPGTPARQRIRMSPLSPLSPREHRTSRPNDGPTVHEQSPISACSWRHVSSHRWRSA